MADHSGHRERLRAEFLARPDSFPEHKLLELLLFYVLPRQDTNPLAHELIERFGSLAGVMDASEEELEKVKGVGKSAGVLLQLIKECNRRYLHERTSTEGVVTDSAGAAAVLHSHFYGARAEMIYVLSLDGKGRQLSCSKVSEGSPNAADVTGRLVMEAALRSNATRVVLAHNHVSGVAIPSDADRATTDYLWDLLEKVGITLVDHLIFTDDDYVSMRESGFFLKPR